MKILKSLIIVALFFSVSINHLTAQGIKYKKFNTAKGVLNWKLEDTQGNLISEGQVVDGEWKQAGGVLKDYLILDKDENNNIKTALVLIAYKKCHHLDFAIQLYHEDEFYPSKNYYKSYKLTSERLNKKPAFFKLVVEDAMYYNFGVVSYKYRAMNGCFLNRLIIPNSESNLKVDIEGKYVFYILGGTDIGWEK